MPTSLTLTPVELTQTALSTGTVNAAVQAALDALARRNYVPIASRASPSFSFSFSELSDGTTQGGTARLNHVALAACHSLRLVYGNFYNHNNSGTGTETNVPNDITVAAAVEGAAPTRPFPVTFGGARTVVIKPGAIAVSDPLGVAFAKGATIGTRTFVSVSAGGFFPRGCEATAFASSEGHNYPATATVGADLTAVGSAAVSSATSRCYTPSAILGLQSGTTPASSVVGIVGDSIAAGSGDSDVGFILRALGANHLYQRIAYPGETVDAFMGSSGQTSYRRKSILELCGITDVICEMGVNSLASGVLLANLNTLWTQLAALGANVYQTTITPVTSSTDSWTTTGNQTVGVHETARLSLNAYIRTVPSPLAGVFEVADLAETSRNSGIWRANYTADGTHPNATAAAALAAAIDTTLFDTTT